MNYNFHKHIQIQIKESNRILKLEHFLKEKKILSYQNPCHNFLNFEDSSKVDWRQMHMQHCYFVELRTLMCGVTSPLLLKKIYQISPWNKNLVSSHTYIYKGKIIDSSDLSVIFSLLFLLLFCFVNILYRKINLQVYISNLLYLKHQNKKKSTWIVHFH